MTSRPLLHIKPLFIIVAVTLTALRGFAYDFAGGTGEPNDPY